VTSDIKDIKEAVKESGIHNSSKILLKLENLETAVRKKSRELHLQTDNLFKTLRDFETKIISTY
jgi:hypothetical protein